MPGKLVRNGRHRIGFGSQLLLHLLKQSGQIVLFELINHLCYLLLLTPQFAGLLRRGGLLRRCLFSLRRRGGLRRGGLFSLLLLLIVLFLPGVRYRRFPLRGRWGKLLLKVIQIGRRLTRLLRGGIQPSAIQLLRGIPCGTYGLTSPLDGWFFRFALNLTLQFAGLIRDALLSALKLLPKGIRNQGALSGILECRRQILQLVLLLYPIPGTVGKLGSGFAITLRHLGGSLWSPPHHLRKFFGDGVLLLAPRIADRILRVELAGQLILTVSCISHARHVLNLLGRLVHFQSQILQAGQCIINRLCHRLDLVLSPVGIILKRNGLRGLAGFPDIGISNGLDIIGQSRKRALAYISRKLAQSTLRGSQFQSYGIQGVKHLGGNWRSNRRFLHLGAFHGRFFPAGRFGGRLCCRVLCRLRLERRLCGSRLFRRRLFRRRLFRFRLERRLLGSRQRRRNIISGFFPRGFKLPDCVTESLADLLFLGGHNLRRNRFGRVVQCDRDRCTDGRLRALPLRWQIIEYAHAHLQALYLAQIKGTEGQQLAALPDGTSRPLPWLIKRYRRKIVPVRTQNQLCRPEPVIVGSRKTHGQHRSGTQSQCGRQRFGNLHGGFLVLHGHNGNPARHIGKRIRIGKMKGQHRFFRRHRKRPDGRLTRAPPDSFIGRKHSIVQPEFGGDQRFIKAYRKRGSGMPEQPQFLIAGDIGLFAPAPRIGGVLLNQGCLRHGRSENCIYAVECAQRTPCPYAITKTLRNGRKRQRELRPR